jgi:hypothetical protein
MKLASSEARNSAAISDVPCRSHPAAQRNLGIALRSDLEPIGFVRLLTGQQWCRISMRPQRARAASIAAALPNVDKWRRLSR